MILDEEFEILEHYILQKLILASNRGQKQLLRLLKTHFYVLILQDRGMVLQLLVYMRTEKLGNFRTHAVLKHKAAVSVLRKEPHISLSLLCCSTVQTVAEYKTRMTFQ